MTPIRIIELPRGRWSPADDVDGAELLVSVIEGLIVCDLALGDIVSSQLLGEGDLLACGDAFETTLPRDQLWTIISPSRVGVIDIATARLSPSWPRVATRLTTAFTSQLRRSAHCRVSRIASSACCGTSPTATGASRPTVSSSPSTSRTSSSAS